MENKYLAKILPFLNEIEEDRRKQFEEYFRTVPMWLMDTFVVEELEKGTVFVQEGEPADMIFFIGKGLVTECTVLKIPKEGFKKWLDSDIVALQQESRLMGEYLLEQARDSRMLLFLQGADRVAFFLMKRYRKYAQGGVLRMKGDRQELSDFTGLCVKTISRSIKKFKENGMITTQGSNIMINYEQYRRMEEMISGILAEDL